MKLILGLTARIQLFFYVFTSWFISIQYKCAYSLLVLNCKIILSMLIIWNLNRAWPSLHWWHLLVVLMDHSTFCASNIFRYQNNFRNRRFLTANIVLGNTFFMSIKDKQFIEFYSVHCTGISTKELSLCHKLWFSNLYIFATQCLGP